MESFLIIFMFAVAVAVHSFEGFINALKDIFGVENKESKFAEELEELKNIHQLLRELKSCTSLVLDKTPRSLLILNRTHHTVVEEENLSLV